MNITRASSAYDAQAATPPPTAAGAVRVGSICHHVASRADFQPVACPALTGELAKVATSVGPRAWANSHRSCAVPSLSPRPTLTCRAAVEDIMRLPSGPSASKYASIAA